MQQPLGMVEKQTTFLAIDGLHTATIEPDQTIALRMHDVEPFRCENNHIFLDTGSPHHVEMVEDLAHYPVVEKGRAIRQGHLILVRGPM